MAMSKFNAVRFGYYVPSSDSSRELSLGGAELKDVRIKSSSGTTIDPKAVFGSSRTFTGFSYIDGVGHVPVFS